jgi:hypothetical protein
MTQKLPMQVILEHSTKSRNEKRKKKKKKKKERKKKKKKKERKKIMREQNYSTCLGEFWTHSRHLIK